MTRQLRFILLAAALLLASCAVSHAARVEHSQFDGSRSVTVDPHRLQCANLAVCTNLGASWNSKHSAHAALQVQLAGLISNITAVAFNIDGEMVELEVKETFTDFYNDGVSQRSTKAFLTTPDLIRRLVGSERTWVRITTAVGSFEGPLVDGQEKSPAAEALERFLAAVDQREPASE